MRMPFRETMPSRVFALQPDRKKVVCCIDNYCNRWKLIRWRNMSKPRRSSWRKCWTERGVVVDRSVLASIEILLGVMELPCAWRESVENGFGEQWWISATDVGSRVQKQSTGSAFPSAWCVFWRSFGFNKGPGESVDSIGLITKKMTKSSTLSVRLMGFRRSLQLQRYKITLKDCIKHFCTLNSK